MPLGLNAVRNLIAAAQAGTLRDTPGKHPRIVKAGHSKVVVGQSYDVWWETRNAGKAFLRVEQGDFRYESLVPVSGLIHLPALSAGLISVNLQLLPEYMVDGTEATDHSLPPIVPIVPRLRFTRLEAPAWGFLGEEFEILWDAPAATGIEIQINDGRRIWRARGENAGVQRVLATHAGRWAVRLVAQGPHGTRTATRFVAVTVTGPRIRLNRRVILGAPGAPAEFMWTITHAQAAFLDMPLRHERHDIGLSGTLQTEIGHRQEDFRLTAVGVDGRRRTLELVTAPYAYPAFLAAD